MKFKTYQNIYSMDIVERDTLSSIGETFDSKTSHSTQEKQSYYDAFINYLNYITNYCEKELKGATFEDNTIIPQVFVNEIKKEQAYKQYLRYSLYCAKLYVSFLQQYIKIGFLERYKVLRLNLMCDIEWLMATYECIVKKSQKKIYLTCGSRNELSPLDMMWVLRELTTIENAPNITNIDLRDIQPYRIFVIRQLLELLGKNVIGYESIVTDKGVPIHKFTQISWQFLYDYSKKKKQWNIIFPIEISNIYAINKWAHSFVHTGHIKASYIQYYAVTVLEKIMKTPNEAIMCYDDKHRISTQYGDFRIEHYDCLKKDFEHYIKNKHIGKKGLLRFFCKQSSPIVKWKDESQIGAYIISK
ncbi:MAG: hypothetical protein HUK00_01130 [Bacteroidaceae bacterium]|nr:hypothetical protein [Bacteroidaceae bacterium]